MQISRIPPKRGTWVTAVSNIRGGKRLAIYDCRKGYISEISTRDIENPINETEFTAPVFIHPNAKEWVLEEKKPAKNVATRPMDPEMISYFLGEGEKESMRVIFKKDHLMILAEA